MAHLPAYASFLIRLWQASPPRPRDVTNGWRGEVERIQTGQRWEFDTPDELLRFLRLQVTALQMGWPADE